MPGKILSFTATELEVTNPLYQINHMMESFSIIVEVIHVAVALKDNLEAAKAYTKAFDSAINSLERTRRLLDDLDRKLTSSEEELLADWKVDCEDILTELHRHSGSSFELHDVGIWKATAALCRRLRFNPKEGDRLSLRLSISVAQLNAIFSSILLARR